MTYKPPDEMIEAARRVACNSPCMKSRRGVVAYVPPTKDQGVVLFTSAFNSQPAPFKCTGTEICRRDCSKLCVHAETRAIARLREVFSGHDVSAIHLLHVKVNPEHTIVAGEGPSCWQCSREVLDAGIAGVWLYESLLPPLTQVPATWRFYTADEFHRATMAACGLGDR